MQEIRIPYSNHDGSFYISYTKMTGHYNMPGKHFHIGYEIYYQISGERYYFIQDRTFHVKEGMLILINTHEVHKTTDTGVQRILLSPQCHGNSL